MKLSQNLLAQHKGFWYKQLWKKKSKSEVCRAKPPKALQEAGVKVINSMDEFFPRPTTKVCRACKTV